MAIELYRNPDGSVGGLDAGEVMVAPTQVEFEACCCVAPCTDCDGEQPNVVVTVAGPCGAQCYDAVSPSYVFFISGVAGSCCYWQWLYTVGVLNMGRLTVYYCPATGEWTAGLQGWHGYYLFGGNYPCMPPLGARCKEITDLVHCNEVTGELVGAFDLDGKDPGWPYDDCTGCTAHVTLGG